jgi:anthranilate phosphoribosyltransferase
MMEILQAIEQVSRGENLSRSQAAAVMESLLSGAAADETIAALLVALRDKGEAAEELTGFAQVMRARAAEVLASAGVSARRLAETGLLLDTCGTGGDGMGTFNVSTAAALVAAAAGARVAKHGNRSISSRCGSADVLESLGVSIDLPLKHIPECLERTGIVFLFAPHLHLAMKHVMNARRSLKTKSVFNLLGPLTNPLGASTSLAGAYDRRHTGMMASALAEAGAVRAFVVASHDGMDEISICAPTQLSEAVDGKLCTRDIRPQDFGFSPVSPQHLAGGDSATNAQILRHILEGRPGPERDIVLVNASAALVVAGLAEDFPSGVDLARQAIDSGAALRTLFALTDFTRQHRP